MEKKRSNNALNPTSSAPDNSSGNNSSKNRPPYARKVCHKPPHRAPRGNNWLMSCDDICSDCEQATSNTAALTSEGGNSNTAHNNTPLNPYV